jgi:galactokinase
MIEIARKHGAYGTKIIGSGGGGSILILSKRLNHKKIISELSKIGVNEIIKANESSGILSL